MITVSKWTNNYSKFRNVQSRSHFSSYGRARFWAFQRASSTWSQLVIDFHAVAFLDGVVSLSMFFHCFLNPSILLPHSVLESKMAANKFCTTSSNTRDWRNYCCVFGSWFLASVFFHHTRYWWISSVFSVLSGLYDFPCGNGPLSKSDNFYAALRKRFRATRHSPTSPSFVLSQIRTRSATR